MNLTLIIFSTSFLMDTTFRGCTCIISYGPTWRQGRSWSHERGSKDQSVASLCISFNFWRRTIMALMDVFHNSRFHWYIDRSGLINITQITIEINISDECMWLRSNYDIRWNQKLKMIFYQLIMGKERRSMVMIFPRHLI